MAPRKTHKAEKPKPSTPAPVVEVKRLGDLIPDSDNANRGTERGRYALSQSYSRCGAGRGILIDREGKIIAGNKSHGVAGEEGFDEVVVVHTNGRQLVATMRDDLDLVNDPKARELALWDNRTSEVGLDWDPAIVLKAKQAGVDIDRLWQPDEVTEIEVRAGVEGVEHVRPSFDDVLGGLAEDHATGQSDKDGNWFYVEFYGKDKLFAELTRLLSDAGHLKGLHQIDQDAFAEMVRAAFKAGRAGAASVARGARSKKATRKKKPRARSKK